MTAASTTQSAHPCFSDAFEASNAFVAYLTAGQRGLTFTEQAAMALVKGGVDVLEIGVPFSDPIADGPVIQAAMHDALSQSLTLNDIFASITRIKQQTKVPIVLFSYLNPLLAYGLEAALREAKQAGVDGVLFVDLPLEAAEQAFNLCEKYQLAPICLLSPSTPDDRLASIAEHGRGFLYYVCRNGITGMKKSLPEGYAERVQHLKAHCDLPIVAGFGISNRALADAALSAADGFVVGSAFVNAITEGVDTDALSELARSIDPRHTHSNT